MRRCYDRRTHHAEANGGRECLVFGKNTRRGTNIADTREESSKAWLYFNDRRTHQERRQRRLRGVHVMMKTPGS